MYDKQKNYFCRGLGEGNLEDEEIAAEDEEDMGVIETYSNYMPSKLKVGLTRDECKKCIGLLAFNIRNACFSYTNLLSYLYFRLANHILIL